MDFPHDFPYYHMGSRSILHGYFNPLVFWYGNIYIRSPAKNLVHFWRRGPPLLIGWQWVLPADGFPSHVGLVNIEKTIEKLP